MGGRRVIRRCRRIPTRHGPVWCLTLATAGNAAVIFIGRTVREAVGSYQAHSRALRGGTP